MKRLLFILFPLWSFGQITYHNSASTPADNGTNTATTTAVTPPASMTTGDLVIIYAYQRGASTTISISASGGQSWTSEATHNSSTATLSGRVFWCRYNGTWSADPSVVFSAGTNTNVVMHVFRPTSSSYSWGLESGITETPSLGDANAIKSFSAAPSIASPGSDLTINTHASTVTVSIWSTDDDNTWGNVSDGTWTNLGTTQYRNTSGSDVSSAYGYRIRTTTGQVNTVTRSEATLGNDPGIRACYTFYEFIPAARRAFLITKK